MTVRLIIAGSRSITDGNWVHSELDRITADITVDEVVSGTARGVDRLGESWANGHDIPVKQFPADWEGIGRGAGYIRNAVMAHYATHLVAFWDGHSRGTQNMIEEARKQHLTIRIVRTDLQGGSQ